MAIVTRARILLDEIERKRQNGEPTDMVLLDKAIELDRQETAELIQFGKIWEKNRQKEIY